MGIRPVFLWSDILIYVLVGGGMVWLWMALKREYWRVAFRQVASNRVGMLSFGILSLYFFVGFLDTLHFRVVDENTSGGGGNITSVLDLVCKPLRTRMERTYSEPFATQEFSMETVTRDGRQERAYPRLQFAGKNLENPKTDAVADIRWRTLSGLGLGLAFGALLWGALVLFDSRRRLVSQRAWVVGFFTLVSILLAVAITLNRDGGYHIFGTDKTGMDIFYISLKSIRTGLIIGTLTTLIVTPFAILFGVMAGYYGGWIDDIIQYVYTTLSSIPDILLIGAAMLILQVGQAQEETIISADKRLVYLCTIMGITSWTGLCRLIRGEVLKLREVEYIQAADAFGVSRAKIMLRHLVPNVMHIILISIVLRFSGLVLAEAVLAYVGIGVDPSMHSWGNMINQARLELARDPVVWWSLLASLLFMLGLVLPANLFGDAVRDALDPRLRKR